MRCFYHTDLDAVATCVDCGKGLCSDCASKFSNPICFDCNMVRIRQNKIKFIKNFILMAVLFAVGLAFGICTATSPGENINVFNLIASPLMFAGFPWGWSKMGGLSKEAFLFIPSGQILFYYIVRFVLSAVIGPFVAPFMIFKAIKDLKDIRRLENYATNYANVNG